MSRLVQETRWGVGLWIVFGHPNPRLIAAVAASALGVHLFVVFYEEPTLRKKFGADYQEYCRMFDAGGRGCEDGT